jgi:hypothetical protein
MDEILPGLFHWSTFHEGIGDIVHSYYVADVQPAFVIDPRVPDEGLGWFAGWPAPAHVYLTNRLHYRHSDRFVHTFGATVWCHSAGLHHFDHRRPVRGFAHDETLPGGVLALPVGALCPEETALYWPRHGGVLSIGDAIIGVDDGLGFVPDALMGDDPAAVKRGLRTAFTRLLARDFDSLLFAHGPPWIGQGKAALAGFLAVVDELEVAGMG